MHISLWYLREGQIYYCRNWNQQKINNIVAHFNNVVVQFNSVVTQINSVVTQINTVVTNLNCINVNRYKKVQSIYASKYWN